MENDDCLFMFVYSLYIAVNCEDILNLISFQVLGSIEGILQFLNYSKEQSTYAMSCSQYPI